MTKYNKETLAQALRSEVMDNSKNNNRLKMCFNVMAFPYDYEETLKGNLSMRIEVGSDDFPLYESAEEWALQLVDELYEEYNEVQLRIYGYYGENCFDGKYDILECRSHSHATHNWHNNNYSVAA